MCCIGSEIIVTQGMGIDPITGLASCCGLGDEPSIPEELISERWVSLSSGLTKCLKHDTLFRREEEPCWQCYNECWLELR